MIKQVIDEMVARGWSYSVIALRSGVSEYRLRDGKLGVREERRVYEVAESEAGICIDDIEEGEEQ